MLTANWIDESSAKGLFKHDAGQITLPLVELQVGSGCWFAAAKRYTGLGIEHILLGFDHLLLIVRGPWMLVKTITAFTITHSITLGLATFGFINVPSHPVEVAIALSIMFLCVEIVHAWVVAFTFGLLYGPGFAGALADIGLPQGEIPVALLFFNVSVEIGQLTFVAAVLLLAWMLRVLHIEKQNWAKVVTAYIIGTLATCWFLERVESIDLPA